MTILDQPQLAVSVRRCQKTWRDHGYAAGGWLSHGPAGFALPLGRDVPTVTGSLIVSQAEHDGVEWLHASIAWPDRMPTYEELTVLHRSVFGPKRTAYQVFAASDRHINLHQYALHLWGRADGQPALPDFGAWGSI